MLNVISKCFMVFIVCVWLFGTFEVLEGILRWIIQIAHQIFF